MSNKNRKMQLWYKKEYYHPILWDYLDTNKAIKYSIEAFDILEELLPKMLFFKYEELISNLHILGQSKLLNKLKSIIPKSELDKFERKISEGEITVSSITDLKGKISKIHKYSNERLVARLLDENEIEISLKLLEDNKIRLNDYISLLCHCELQPSEIFRVLKQLRKSKEFSIRNFCIRIGRDILSNQISLDEGLAMVSEFEPLTDLEKSVFSSWLANSKNYKAVKRIYNTFESKQEYKYSAINLSSRAATSNDKQFRILCTDLLNNTKKDKEVKLYLLLMNEICRPDLKLDDALLSIINSNKRHQPDDEIFYYLVKQNRIKDAKLLVDVVQGVNKKHHYAALVKHLLNDPPALKALFDEKKYNTISQEAVSCYSKNGNLTEAKYWLKKKIKDSQLKNVLWRNIIKSLIIQNKFSEIDEIINSQINIQYKFNLYLFVSSYLIGKNHLV